MLAERTRNGAHLDEGFTLIEMIVATLLFSLVTITIAGVIISATTAERSVRTVTSATSAGQLVMRTLDAGLSSAASPITVTASGSDQYIVARVPSKGATLTWGCSAWYFSSADRTIRQTTSSSAISISASGQRSWTLLADSVRQVGTTPVFAASGTVGAVVTFTVDAGNTKPVSFASTITTQSPATGVGTC
jgi:prepilin-type N-terminal cleavage/methylation domain-containing protein